MLSINQQSSKKKAIGFGNTTVTNQGNNFYNSDIIKYDSLNYRSSAEVAIAKAIDKYNEGLIGSDYLRIYYMPNNLLVTNKKNKHGFRDKIEADFTIFVPAIGNGILEVDGEQHNDLKVRKRDAFKENIWRSMGFRVIERFSAADCLNDPVKVLNLFISRLEVVYYQLFPDTHENWENHYRWDVWYRFYRCLQLLSLPGWALTCQICVPLDFDGYTFKIGFKEGIKQSLIENRIADLNYHLAANNNWELSYTFNALPDPIEKTEFKRLQAYLTDEIKTKVENQVKQFLQDHNITRSSLHSLKNP